jgi:hypothetical protein
MTTENAESESHKPRHVLRARLLSKLPVIYRLLLPIFFLVLLVSLSPNSAVLPYWFWLSLTSLASCAGLLALDSVRHPHDRTEKVLGCVLLTIWALIIMGITVGGILVKLLILL